MRRKHLVARLGMAAAKYAEDEVFLQKLKSSNPGNVDLAARAESLAQLDAAHQRDAEEIQNLQITVRNMPQDTAIQRLGDVLYWLGCGLAVVALGMGLYFSIQGDTGELLTFFGIVAVVIWLVGRACRYVLAGE